MTTKKKPKNFIKAAINPKHTGQFAAKAKAAGMSTAAYAAHEANDPNADPATKKQAVLAKTLIGMNKKKKGNK